MMDFNEFVGALRSAGWYSKADAQHRHIRVVWETLIARAEAAEAEVERLRQELATVAADVKLMLRTPHNHDWLASGDCPRCAIEQRLIANTTPARQRSSGGAVDDD